MFPMYRTASICPDFYFRKVVDAGGLELPGVNVMVKGTTIGTLTDGDGRFTIPDVPGGSNAVLVFLMSVSRHKK